MNRVAARTAAVGLLFSLGAPTGAALAADPAELLLLQRASFWRAQQRPDLAADILAKILTTNPSQPDALYQRGRLALEQGDRGSAAEYFDRLRTLAAADQHAAELLALAQPSAAPAEALATKAAVATTDKTKPVIPAPTPAIAMASAPTPAADPAPPPIPAKVVTAALSTPIASGSADSDDLIAAPAANTRSAAQPQPAVAAAAPAAPTQMQFASLPAVTVSDGDAVAPSSAETGSGDTGKAARSVQVAQVELQPPPPVGGYQALGTLRPYSPSDTLEVYIERDLENLEMQANPSLIAGFGYRTHSGTEGLGRLDEIGGSAQFSFSPWYTGTASIAVMPAYVDAGKPANGNLVNFGANPIRVVNGIAAANAREQDAFGVGLLGTYSYADFTGQFGTTPLGFPVVNFIGDVAYAPKFLNGNMTVRFEGFRQPVTDSVLSYAGTHASLSTANAFVNGAFGNNTLWGGVVKTGPRVTAFYDDQMYGAYGGVGYSWLTGNNVADNSELDALLGAYFRPWKTDYWTLRVGVSAFYAGYDKNLSGYTWGNGGYFSPQDFEGIGFPLEISGSYDQWSYLFAPTLGTQHFNSKSSPIFPITPAAQLTMQALSPSNAFNNGQHGGWGFGFNIKGQVEYAVDKTLSFGIAGSANNSNNYDEGIVQVYLRKTFDWFAPVAFKNDAVSIASRDHL